MTMEVMENIDQKDHICVKKRKKKKSENKQNVHHKNN